MQTDRRTFLTLTAAGLTADVFVRGPFFSTPELKAVAFDAFAIFDPTSVQRLTEQLFPDKGLELLTLWRARQFEYQWLHTLIGSYADFWRCTEDSLVFAGELLKLDLTSEKRKRLMNSYLELQTWPEVPAVLRNLNSQGLHLAFLSNATPEILQAGMRNSGTHDLFQHVLSTSRVRTFKPDPRAYQMAVEAFGLRKDEILFVAFAGWDAAGAKGFGFPTFWMNRMNLPGERLGFSPDSIGRDLNDLVAFVGNANHAVRL